MRKKHIFVDAAVLTASNYSGIGHYVLDLLRAVDKELSGRQDIDVTLGVYFREVDRVRILDFKNFRVRRTLFSPRIANALKSRGVQPWFDVFFGRYLYFFPNYTSWPLLFSKCVSVIYDLSFEYFPQYVDPPNQKFLSANVKKSVARSAKILTISKNSQKEICDFYGRKKKDVPIVYPGIDKSVFFRWPKDEVEKVKAKYGLFGDYILFIGNIEPRKNLKSLLLAYEKLDKKIRDAHPVALVGAKGWLNNEIYAIIERLRVGGNRILQPTDWVEDADRPALYSGASLFVYPSHYEGFGIPPVEAMACGVPTITSDNSSLPEAAGIGAIQVSADSTAALAKAMEKVLTDEKTRAKMINDGLRQAEMFNWGDEAKKLIAIFEDL
jgi:glycosyltransferase involved in cell wall biosynthesis